MSSFVRTSKASESKEQGKEQEERIIKDRKEQEDYEIEKKNKIQ